MFCGGFTMSYLVCEQQLFLYDVGALVEARCQTQEVIQVTMI